MSDVATSTAADFLTQLSEEGATITWESRSEGARNQYGEPVAKFTKTTMKAVVRLLQPFEVRLVEPGFVMQNYLKILFDPAVIMAILDRVVYGGSEFEVRFVAPHQVAGITVYSYAIMRILIAPPAG